MKTKHLAWLVVGAAAAVLAYVGSPQAAPAPPGPVEKWEYAEIIFSPAAARARRGADDTPFGGARRGVGRGGRGGRGGVPGGGGAPGAPGGGAAPPAFPPQQVQLPVRQALVRWITAAGEVEATSWQELAEKLKLPPARSGVVTPAAHRLRVLNHLGGQGWEMVSGSSTSACIFKRKVAK